MPRVIHTAQALVDATALIPDLPRRGQNVMAADWSQQAGGAGADGMDGTHCGPAALGGAEPRMGCRA